ncbi:response regulator transcription factor [Pseudaminobacter soli (ex Li et al. 2025)]|uniref:DNA-binding response regulator n=1 Tax=Pseudaminobacter soli (ex Li et al. 2025) TaxID=1295366 RepID=A0A2P7RPJ4_9HYPH|nr:response regulator transcription factor [Mesorhizobium soli]PSJ52142.1 hypothetical protein C7I85_29100 [Mesorhizobium soli]
MDILIIEDDKLICESIQRLWPVPSDNLRFISTYKQSINFVHGSELKMFDGAIVDIHLPDGDGLTTLRTIRENTDVPIVLISGSGTANSRADAIDLGADDYVMKPFSIRELQARMARLVAVRNRKERSTRREQFTIGRVACDLQKRTISHTETEAPLTDTEARILGYLYRNRNINCSKSSLYKNAFFRDYDPSDKTLDVYISRLRKKIAKLDQWSSEWIQTARGAGYRYSEP